MAVAYYCLYSYKSPTHRAFMFNVVVLDDGRHDVEVVEVDDDHAVRDVEVVEAALVYDDDGDHILQAAVMVLRIATHIVYAALVVKLYNNVLRTQEV